MESTDSMSSTTEAAEQILEGENWIWCPHCLGQGFDGSISIRVHGKDGNSRPGFEDLKLPTPCDECNGVGNILHPAYRMALLKLSLPLPAPRPPKRSSTKCQNLFMVERTSGDPQPWFPFSIYSAVSAEYIGVWTHKVSSDIPRSS